MTSRKHAEKLWEQGIKSFQRRKRNNPQDPILDEVMELLLRKLRELVPDNNIDHLLQVYYDLGGKELYGDKWDHYNKITNHHIFEEIGKGEMSVSGVLVTTTDDWGSGNYVILSTFEDAAYYIRCREMLRLPIKWK